MRLIVLGAIVLLLLAATEIGRELEQARVRRIFDQAERGGR